MVLSKTEFLHSQERDLTQLAEDTYKRTPIKTFMCNHVTLQMAKNQTFKINAKLKIDSSILLLTLFNVVPLYFSFH